MTIDNMKNYYKTILVLFFNILFCNIIKPENGSNLNYIHVLFEWEQMNNANGYEFMLDNQNDFLNPILHFTTTSLAYIDVENIEWNSNYYWKIRPLDGFSPWLETHYFSTGDTRSNASTITYNANQYADGITIFSSFFNYFTAMIDQNGNEIWNSEYNNTVYYNTDYFGEYFGCYVDNSLDNYLPGIQFTMDNEHIWNEPNDHFLHHELIEINEQYYMGLIETEQLGPIPLGDWTSTFQILGYVADGVTNEFPWIGDKIVIWDKNTNQVVWEWDTFEHFSMLDYDDEAVWELALSLGKFDWTHANALWPEFDDAGNLKSIYISSRHLSRITKIDYPSGNITWNMGLDMPSGDVHCGHDIKFSWQHSLTVNESNNGNTSEILFLDNGNLSQSLNNTEYPTSRGLEITVIDNGDNINPSCTATVDWEYSLAPEYFGFASGNVQKLDNDNYLLVTVGDAGTALEVNQFGTEVWKGNFALQQPNGAVYRANRISGLYPIAYSMQIDNLINNENNNVLSINTQDIDTISMIIQNIGSSELEYIAEIFLDTGELHEYFQSSLPVSTNNINPNILNIDFTLPDSDYITLKFTPIQRPDLKKEITIYFEDGDCDSDGDGICDEIDICPYDNLNDIDNDGVCGNDDICPYDTYDDSDDDGSCDSADICLGNDNSGDSDLDGYCNDIDICPNDFFNDYDNDGICNSDDPCPDDPNNNCGNNNPCDSGYSYLSTIPNSTIILDGDNCFNNNDLSVINDIIATNNLDIDSPIYLGTQNWNNGRLTRIEVGNYFQGGNVILTEIPNTIGNLDQLAVLYLNENELTELPENITQLNNLVYLVLSFNQLTSLPTNIGNLSNLIWIDAGYNQLELIPDSIVELENLIYLWIFNNNLSSLPNYFCNLNLNWNDLDYNFLPYFGCGGNQLCENLPECVENSSNLNTSIDPLYYSFVIEVEQDCEETCFLMDVNDDGTINVVDIVNTVNIIFNAEATEQQLCAADANQDGAINVVDIVNIVNYIFEN